VGDAALTHLGHLARRFVGSLRPGGPSHDDEAWVAGLLSDGELALWRRMSGADRRHAVGVARRVARTNDDQNLLVAALLHDVGKVESGLGTLERAAATGTRLLHAPVPSRWQRYFDHPRTGAALLAAAGSDPLVVTWAREHHLPPSRWTVPPEAGALLKAADDD
jgi:HD domain